MSLSEKFFVSLNFLAFLVTGASAYASELAQPTYGILEVQVEFPNGFDIMVGNKSKNKDIAPVIVFQNKKAYPTLIDYINGRTLETLEKKSDFRMDQNYCVLRFNLNFASQKAQSRPKLKKGYQATLEMSPPSYFEKGRGSRIWSGYEFTLSRRELSTADIINGNMKNFERHEELLDSVRCTGNFDNPSKAIEEAIGGDVVKVAPAGVYKFQKDSGGNVTQSVVEGDREVVKEIKIFPHREKTGLLDLPVVNTSTIPVR